MTRYLSQALGAEEPHFSQNIAALEQASGLPSEDIRLSSEVMQRAREKIAALGLDPNDTTAEELYAALHERLRSDDALVRKLLNISTDATPSEVVASVCTFLDRLLQDEDCFVLKTSVARRLLKKNPPKNAMKKLGYRSIDSLLKREHPALVYAATFIAEGSQWHKRYRSLYIKLRPSDFESRKISFYNPSNKHWQKLAQEYVDTSQRNIFCFKDLGAVVLLPINERLDGLAIMQLLMALDSMNDIRAQSSFAKLQQVKSDFGAIMQRTSMTEPLTTAILAGQPVSWRMIQRYYGRASDRMAAAFEPHLQAEDLRWHDAEDVLTDLNPGLSFWQHTQCLCIMNHDGPVSMNILDVALNYCNHLPFNERVVRFLRDNLWHELMSRYLHQQNLEDALQQQLTAGLINAEPALAELV
jgi:hypothetical protein